MTDLRRMAGAAAAIAMLAVAGWLALHGARAEAASDAIDVMAAKEPVVAHDVAAGWAEETALLVDRDFALIVFDVNGQGQSHVMLARVPRSGGQSSVKEISVDRGGQIESGPSIASDAEGGAWVAWTSLRDSAWAIRAARVKELDVGPEVLLSEPGGLQSQVRLDTGDKVTCFVWSVWGTTGYKILARTYDGKLGKIFTVYEGSYPVGRPDVRVLARDRLAFAWDEYLEGRFVIRMREMVGGVAADVETFGEGRPGEGFATDYPAESGIAPGDNWEPHLAGREGNLLLAWHRVPEDGFKLEPAAAVPGSVELARKAIEPAGGNETWRVRCMGDAEGNTWLVWTTRLLFHSTSLFVRKVGPEGMGRTCKIDFPMEKTFLTVFDCRLDRDLFVAWNRSGSVYLAQVTARELPASLYYLCASPWEPDSTGLSAGDTGTARSVPDDLEAEGGDSQPSGNHLVRRPGLERVGPPEPGHSTFYEGESLHVFFGDYHNHSSFSDGRAYPDICLQVARDRRHLDFAALTDHEEAAVPGQYAWTNAVESLLSQEGKFACLHGFEASKGWGRGGYGHWNVLFAAGGKDFHFERGMTPLDIYAFARDNDAILVPHHVAKKFAPHNWDYNDPVAEPVVEMCSIHGIFERPAAEDEPDMVPGHFVDDALARGYVFGFVGASDSHNCFEIARAEYGLTGVYAPSLSPRAIFQAMKQRRTFALTGGGIVVDFRCNGRLMGERLAAQDMKGALVLSGYAQCPDSIVSVEIVSNGGVVYETKVHVPEISVTWNTPVPDAETYYYLRVTSARGDLAWSSPIWIGPRQ
jgi:hypothetical protein